MHSLLQLPPVPVMEGGTWTGGMTHWGYPLVIKHGLLENPPFVDVSSHEATIYRGCSIATPRVVTGQYV